MSQTIRSYRDDPMLVAKVEEGLELPFEWDPEGTTLAQALEESRRKQRDLIPPYPDNYRAPK